MDINGSGAFHRGIESEEAGRCTPRRLFATFDINLQKKLSYTNTALKKVFGPLKQTSQLLDV